MTLLAHLSRLLPAGTARFRAITAQAVLRAWTHRREVAKLAECDDRMLKDIGLTRSEVTGALAGDWLRDPSLTLAERRSSAGVRAVVQVEGFPTPQAARLPASALHIRKLPVATC